MGNDPFNKVDPSGEFGIGFEQAFKGSTQSLRSNSLDISKERAVATVLGEASRAKEGLDAAAKASDAITVGAIATGQVEIAAVSSAISTAASLAGNAVDRKANDYVLAEGTGQAMDMAAENTVKGIGEAAGMMGVRGKLVEKVINVTAEAASQQVSQATSNEYLKDAIKTKPFTNSTD